MLCVPDPSASCFPESWTKTAPVQKARTRHEFNEACFYESAAIQLEVKPVWQAYPFLYVRGAVSTVWLGPARTRSANQGSANHSHSPVWTERLPQGH